MDNTGATVVPPGVLTEGRSGPFGVKPGLVGGITGKRGGGGVELGNCTFPGGCCAGKPKAAKAFFIFSSDGPGLERLLAAALFCACWFPGPC